MLGPVVTQHDHALAVDRAEDPQNWAVPTFEAHFKTHPYLTKNLRGLLIMQFIDALADIPAQLQRLIDAQIVNAYEC